MFKRGLYMEIDINEVVDSIVKIATGDFSNSIEMLTQILT